MFYRLTYIAVTALFLITDITSHLPKKTFSPQLLSPETSFSLKNHAAALIESIDQQFGPSFKETVLLSRVTPQQLQGFKFVQEKELVLKKGAFSRVSKARQSFREQRMKSLKLEVPAPTGLIVMTRGKNSPERKLKNFIKVYKALKRKIDAYREAVFPLQKGFVVKIQDFFQQDLNPEEMHHRGLELLKEGYFLYFLLHDATQAHFVLPGSVVKGSDERFNELLLFYKNNEQNAANTQVKLADLSHQLGRLLQVLHNSPMTLTYLTHSHKLSGMPQIPFNLEELILFNMIHLNLSQEAKTLISHRHGSTTKRYNNQGIGVPTVIDWSSEAIDVDIQLTDYDAAKEKIKSKLEKEENPNQKIFYLFKQMNLHFSEAEESLLKQGLTEEVKNKFEAVIAEAETLYKAEGDKVREPVVLTTLMALVRIQSFAQAEEFLEQEVDLEQSSNSLLLSTAAIIKTHQKKPAEAFVLLERMIQSAPFSPYTYRRLFQTFAYMGLSEQALWAFMKGYLISGQDLQFFGDFFRLPFVSEANKDKLVLALLSSPMAKKAVEALSMQAALKEHSLHPREMIPTLMAIFQHPIASEKAKGHARELIQRIEELYQISYLKKEAPEVVEKAPKKPSLPIEAKKEEREPHWIHEAFEWNLEKILDLMATLRARKPKTNKTSPLLRSSAVPTEDSLTQLLNKFLIKVKSKNYENGVDSEERAKDYYLIVILTKESRTLDKENSNQIIHYGFEFFKRGLTLPNLNLLSFGGKDLAPAILFFRSLTSAVLSRVTEPKTTPATIRKIKTLMGYLDSFSNSTTHSKTLSYDALHTAQGWLYLAATYVHLNYYTKDVLEKKENLKKARQLLLGKKELIIKYLPRDFYHYLLKIEEGLENDKEATAAAESLVNLALPIQSGNTLLKIPGYQYLNDDQGLIELITKQLDQQTSRQEDAYAFFFPLAKSLMRLDKKLEALIAFHRAHTLKPKDPDALLNIATILSFYTTDNKEVIKELESVFEDLLALNHEATLKFILPLIFAYIEKEPELFKTLSLKFLAHNDLTAQWYKDFLLEYNGDLQTVVQHLKTIRAPRLPKKKIRRQEKIRIERIRSNLMNSIEIVETKIRQIELPKRREWLQKALPNLPEEIYADLFSKIEHPLSHTQTELSSIAKTLFLNRIRKDYPYLQDIENKADRVIEGVLPFSTLAQLEAQPFIQNWQNLEIELPQILVEAKQEKERISFSIEGSQITEKRIQSKEELIQTLIKKSAFKLISVYHSDLFSFSQNSNKMEQVIDLTINLLLINEEALYEQRLTYSFLQQALLPLVLRNHLGEQSDFIGEEALIQVQDLVEILEIKQRGEPNFIDLRKKINAKVLERFQQYFPSFSKRLSAEDILIGLYHPDYNWEDSMNYFMEKTSIELIDLEQTSLVPKIRMIIDRSGDKPAVHISFLKETPLEVFLNNTSSLTIESLNEKSAKWIIGLREEELLEELKQRGLSLPTEIKTAFGPVQWIENSPEWPLFQQGLSAYSLSPQELKRLFATASYLGQDFTFFTQLRGISKREYQTLTLLRYDHKEKELFLVLEKESRTKKLISVSFQSPKDVLDRLIQFSDYSRYELLSTVTSNSQAENFYFRTTRGRFRTINPRIIVYENTNGFYELDLNEVVLKGISFTRASKMIYDKTKNGQETSEQIASELNLLRFPYTPKKENQRQPEAKTPPTKNRLFPIHLPKKLQQNHPPLNHSL